MLSHRPLVPGSIFNIQLTKLVTNNVENPRSISESDTLLRAAHFKKTTNNRCQSRTILLNEVRKK